MEGMVTFDGEVRDVTPTNYFEAPIMVKRGGRYFLMNSTGTAFRSTRSSSAGKCAWTN
jgi:hypothetical protein